MRYINTINNNSYNAKEREKLGAMWNDAQAELDKMHDAADNIDSDSEYEKMLDQIDEYRENVVTPAYRRMFAAQFHNCKNNWFVSVIQGFKADNERHIITQRQYDCFVKYACDEDSNSWKDGTSYCRCDGKLITLYRHNALIAIKVTQL